MTSTDKPITALPVNPSTNRKEVSPSLEHNCNSIEKKGCGAREQGACLGGIGKVGKGGNVAGQQKEKKRREEE